LTGLTDVVQVGVVLSQETFSQETFSQETLLVLAFGQVVAAELSTAVEASSTRASRRAVSGRSRLRYRERLVIVSSSLKVLRTG
jgi:hypothetical protein